MDVVRSLGRTDAISEGGFDAGVREVGVGRDDCRRRVVHLKMAIPAAQRWKDFDADGSHRLK